MYRLIVLFFLLFLPVLALSESTSGFQEYSRMIDVPGIGSVQYYAQTDPLWDKMIYEYPESKTRRFFGGSGCGPTAAAMAIARLIPTESLPNLIEHAKNPENGFPFCACSVSYNPCYNRHLAMTPETPEEFLTYLPVIFASYATGNNDVRMKARTKDSGTHAMLYKQLADAYSLEFHTSHRWDYALSALQRGATVVTACKDNAFTASSHFLCLISADDEYIYVLDPDLREEYGRDKIGYLDVLEPGLVRIHLEDVSKVRLYGFYIFESED